MTSGTSLVVQWPRVCTPSAGGPGSISGKEMRFHLLELWVSMKVKVTRSCQMFATHRLYSPLNSLGMNTGVGSLSLLQVIFPTQGSSQPRDQTQVSLIAGGFFTSWATREAQILEWVAYPFSSRFSQPRNQTRVSCIAGRFFTNWAIREALKSLHVTAKDPHVSRKLEDLGCYN